MVRINITNEEYETLLFMMGHHSNEVLKTDPEFGRKLISLYVSIVGKRQNIPDVSENKKPKRGDAKRHD